MLSAKHQFQKIQIWLKNLPRKITQNLGTILIVVFLSVWLSLFLSKEIDLTSIDLGRHLENGHYFLEEHKIPRTNLYSYTYPEMAFINHHWGSGVILFLIWKFFNFSGLSFFYITLSLITFLILFLLTKRISNLTLATLTAVFAIPLIGERTEVRPEVFSYFFSALFLWLLWRYKYEKLSLRWLILLPVLMIIWVNLHVYFIFGIGIIGLFFLDAILVKNKQQLKILTFFLSSTIITTCLNPFGIQGALYPLNIFRNYGYRVLENQSVSFLDKLGFITDPNLGIFKLMLVLLIFSTAALSIFNRKKITWPILGLSLAISLLGWSALRNFALFGYFFMPIMAYNLKYALEKIDQTKNTFKLVVFSTTLIFFMFISYLHRDNIFKETSGNAIAEVSKINSSANFFKDNALQGPIFNNYDIGSFLIFQLFPQEKVFVDNRPEAYPTAFFQDTYIPMQENETTWKEMLKKYDFNVIYFSVNDATPWGQGFLLSRIKDPDWAPIYADYHSIIFLKRNDKNKDLIAKFEMAKSNFNVK